MYVKITGIEFGHVKFSAIVLVDSLEEAQEGLEDLMIIAADNQLEFEEAITELGFEIIHKECEPEGETFVIIIDKEDKFF